MMIKILKGFSTRSPIAKPILKIERFFMVFGLSTFFILNGCQKDDDFNTLDIKTFPERQKDFSLWQLAQFNFEVQMCYIIRSDDGKITVVDGGMPSSKEWVVNYINQLGGHVNTWVITHPHFDHMGVLKEVLKSKEISIDRLIHSKLDNDWAAKYEIESVDLVSKYNRIINESAISVIVPDKGDYYSLGDGVDLEVIAVNNDSITINAINNSSLVFKIKSESKSVLFLGDLGVEGGNAVLKSVDHAQLKADYVQMAHHGQAGVGLEFYKVVDPDYALWPTPKWLWENSAKDQGPGTGNFQIPEVRLWVDDELNVKKNYVAGLEGNIQID